MDSVDVQEQYVQMVLDYNRCQWENYVCDASHSLTELDDAIYNLVLQNRENPTFSGRRAQVWQSVSRRDLVDRHPEVAGLRDRLDLHNRGQYRDGPHSSDREIAVGMTPDVLRLMRLRDHYSQQQGFRSYVDLVFTCEELSAQRVKSQVERFVTDNLPTARCLADRHDVRQSTWFSDLRSLGSGYSIGDLDVQGGRFLQALNLDELRDSIHLHIVDGGFGFCRPLGIPGDVRVMVDARANIANLATLYHEMGHAVGHAANRTSGLYLTCTASHDEAMAVVGELVGLRIGWSGEILQRAEEISLMEDVRCGVSCLFEFDLWEDPSRAEELYANHYAQLGFTIEQPEIWALDTFRSLDPLYNHNYVLGRILAEKTYGYLCATYGHDPVRWGRWLVDNYYASGRRLSLAEKVAPVCGYA